MQAITKKATQEELAAIYNDAKETADAIEELNNTMDAVDPMLDRLNEQLDIYHMKSSWIRDKINGIMAKL